jgi:hypothetical protein
MNKSKERGKSTFHQSSAHKNFDTVFLCGIFAASLLAAIEQNSKVASHSHAPQRNAIRQGLGQEKDGSAWLRHENQPIVLQTVHGVAGGAGSAGGFCVDSIRNHKPCAGRTEGQNI